MFRKVYHRFFFCSIVYFTDGVCVLHDAGGHNAVIQQEIDKTALTRAGLTCYNRKSKNVLWQTGHDEN